MTRKALGKLLVMLFVLLVIAVGCSSDDTGSNTESDNGVNDGAESGTLPEMTDDEITLTYASWKNHELNEFLADKFMEKYPNITVEVVPLDTEGWNDNLTNLASTGELPDVFWYNGNVDIAIRNGWLGDFTEYFEADPETEDLLDTMVDPGYFDGERKMAAATDYFPYAVFLDENLFERMNVDMPSPDWTYNEMIDLIQEMTVPEQGIFGYNTGGKLLTIAPIVNQDAVGEFGWDGEKYDLTTDWAEAANLRAEFIRSGVHAPLFDTDEAEAAFGDREIWPASTGKVAIQIDAWWTVGAFSEPEFTDKGMKWVPYVVPKGDNAETENKPAYIDFGTISPATEHPREAYELMKFFGWSKDGWEAKLEAFKTMEDGNGNLVFKHPDGLPLIKDQEIWDELRTLLPDSHYHDDFLERAKNPVSLGGRALPGFETFLGEVYFGGEYGDVETAITNGEVNAHDIAPDLTEKANEYYEAALEELNY
ncbi:ABC transporter substrate-binding protein [Gracilibacillus alcaliphilus]|uniref:ABC transporter substrate-binding protein n=1 Tax=Gracilibacillus alcaliphilus TaxID=1401441 RepID=UPI00195CB1E6|nr:extracellular solute-binding protein [Gracilibacillus alcaliphilus]MBM7675705.1 multiple sugar transport system substrate-binding protein [Gracilibacillus alcaliphilus]